MMSMNENLISIEHEEEILVLKSIFDEDFVSIDNDQLTFDLIVRFDSLPNSILLIHDETKISMTIFHLPPIKLHITLIKTYPKLDPPLYCILCDYLTNEQLVILADQMDKMWKVGDVIIYTWIEFLKDYIYNMNNQFILFNVKSIVNDKRFLTNYNQIGSKKIYEQLIEYNQIQCQMKFEQTNHICPICLEEKAGKYCLQFEKCYHYACLTCLKSHANEYLLHIQQQPINCFECGSSLFLSELRRIFSDDKLLVKYQQRLLEQTVDMIWCPRCHHSIICLPSESISGNHRSFVECFHCRFTFCRRCQDTWHPQIQCPKEKLFEDVQQNLNANSNRTKLSVIELQKLLVEIENVQTIEKCTKPCPSCGVRIEKNGGCQHMNCLACQIHFCWTCGWYGRAYSPHPCQAKPDKSQALLSSDTNDMVEQILYDANGKRIESGISKRVQICPRENCRRVHVKIGTRNMLMCEKCEKYFCFLCGEAVYGSFHFSEYGCKADTPT